jgi:hypothetical protein
MKWDKIRKKIESEIWESIIENKIKKEGGEMGRMSHMAPVHIIDKYSELKWNWGNIYREKVIPYWFFKKYKGKLLWASSQERWVKFALDEDFFENIDQLNLDWHWLSERKNLTLEIVDRHWDLLKHKIWWDGYLYEHRVPFSFIKKKADFDWNKVDISSYLDVTPEEIEGCKDIEWDKDSLSYNRYLPIIYRLNLSNKNEFKIKEILSGPPIPKWKDLDGWRENLSLNQLVQYFNDIPEEWIEEKLNDLKQVSFLLTQKVSPSFILKHLDFPWNMEGLELNKKITLEEKNKIRAELDEYKSWRNCHYIDISYEEKFRRNRAAYIIQEAWKYALSNPRCEIGKRKCLSDFQIYKNGRQ